MPGLLSGQSKDQCQNTVPIRHRPRQKSCQYSTDKTSSYSLNFNGFDNINPDNLSYL